MTHIVTKTGYVTLRLANAVSYRYNESMFVESNVGVIIVFILNNKVVTILSADGLASAGAFKVVLLTTVYKIYEPCWCNMVQRS